MTATASNNLPSQLRGVVCVLVSLLVAGCSSFNSDWKKTAGTAISPDTIEGGWEGSWLSAVKGHHGALRCIMTRIDDTQYRARYRATYWKMFRIGYTMAMRVEPQPGRAFKMQGENDLGWWGGGVYRYDGEASATNFLATYRSKYDHGTFEMKRPAPR